MVPKLPSRPPFAAPLRRLLLLAAFALAAFAAATPVAGARPYKKACAKPAPHRVACHAEVVTTSAGSATPLVTFTPSGYGPADLQSAYNLTTAAATAGTSQTIAIVDAYDNPNAESDLAVYRAQYGLTPCTTDNGCFRKVNQTGGTSYPSGDTGWGEEIALDLQMASATCPNCRILLVEAGSTNMADLGASVNTAASLGATQISNSYGGSEFSSETYSESSYNHPGVDITVSSGDSGYGVEFPAASRYVTAVGGTKLTRSGNTRGWAESAWGSTLGGSGAGSGCSAYVPKPAWQHDSGCAKRTVADVSAVADPNTGVAVYDTYESTGGGWLVVGGTSAAAPIVAGAYAVAGGRSGSTTYGSFAYTHSTAFNDVTSGANGTCASGAGYLCTAGAGYDGPTGMGTPSGAAPPGPAAPQISTPAAGTVTRSAAVTLSGSAGADSTVEVFDGTASQGTTTADGSGAWSMTLAGVADGAHTYTAKASNADGASAASNAVTVTVDTVAPAAPQISSPADGALTKSSAITVSGSAEANAKIEVLDGTVSKGTTTANSSGAWSKALTGVADGAHSYTAKATDAAGNTSSATNPVALTVDTVAPSAPRLSSPASGTHTLSTTVALAGWAEPGATVELFDGPVPQGRVTAGAGGWSKTLTGLARGSHAYTARATDAAGNVSDVSPAVGLTVDTPLLAVVPGLDPGHARVTASTVSGRGSTLTAETHGRVGAVVSNANPFPVAGSASLASRSKVSVGRGTRAVVAFGRTSLHLSAARSAKVTVRLSRRNLALLKRLRRVPVRLSLLVHDPEGHAARVTRDFTLAVSPRRRR